jgi:hypothetical protein
MGLIEIHRTDLDQLVAALLERETLERDELEQLLGEKRATPGAAEPVGHVAASAARPAEQGGSPGCGTAIAGLAAGNQGGASCSAEI